MVKGPPHCEQVVRSMAKTRVSNWAQLILARRDGFNPDLNNLSVLQLGKDSIQDPTFGPTIHAGVDSMPIPKILGQPAPFAPLLRHIQNRIEDLYVG
jgi:hypothetical protein